jgi:hypothetical protein
MDNLELDLKLTVAHVNAILKHLAQGVYSEVADLIQLLHGQAKPQIESAVSPAPVEAASEEQPAQ